MKDNALVLHYYLFKADRKFLAQCVEYDFVSEGSSIPEAIKEFRK